MLVMDTYALVAIQNHSENYNDIVKEDFIITSTTMSEFYFQILKTHDEKTADYWYKKLAGYCINTSTKTLVEAMRYKYEHKKEKLSFFDCVGYIYSIENNFKFVTGDKEFKNKKGVLFIPE